MHSALPVRVVVAGAYAAAYTGESTVERLHMPCSLLLVADGRHDCSELGGSRRTEECQGAVFWERRLSNIDQHNAHR
jgi:hypothetical protein